jgi:hypothetical protein
MHKKLLSEHLKGRNHFEDLGADGGIILKWCGRVWTGFIWLRFEASGVLRMNLQVP